MHFPRVKPWRGTVLCCFGWTRSYRLHSTSCKIFLLAPWHGIKAPRLPSASALCILRECHKNSCHPTWESSASPAPRPVGTAVGGECYSPVQSKRQTLQGPINRSGSVSGENLIGTLTGCDPGASCFPGSPGAAILSTVIHISMSP